MSIVDCVGVLGGWQRLGEGEREHEGQNWISETHF